MVSEKRDYGKHSLTGRVTKTGEQLMDLHETCYEAAKFRSGSQDRLQLLKDASTGYEQLLEDLLRADHDPDLETTWEAVVDYVYERLETPEEHPEPVVMPPGIDPSLPIAPQWRWLYMSGRILFGPGKRPTQTYVGEFVFTDTTCERTIDGWSAPKGKDSWGGVGPKTIARASAELKAVGIVHGLQHPSYADDLQMFYQTHGTLDEPFREWFLHRVDCTEDEWEILDKACEEVPVNDVAELVFEKWYDYSFAASRSSRENHSRYERAIQALDNCLAKHELAPFSKRL